MYILCIGCVLLGMGLQWLASRAWKRIKYSQEYIKSHNKMSEEVDIICTEVELSDLEREENEQD